MQQLTALLHYLANGYRLTRSVSLTKKRKDGLRTAVKFALVLPSLFEIRRWAGELYATYLCFQLNIRH